TGAAGRAAHHHARGGAARRAARRDAPRRGETQAGAHHRRRPRAPAATSRSLSDRHARQTDGRLIRDIFIGLKGRVRGMKLAQFSLYYLVGYLVFGGVGLVADPELALRLLFATGSYGDIMPRLAGML